MKSNNSLADNSDIQNLRDSELREESWWHKILCCIEIGYKE